VTQVVATLIGDVVRSRAATDRGGLHAALSAALDAVNRDLDPVLPLRVTVGDEYQGAFSRVGEALQAALRLRLALAPAVQVRHGLGWGGVDVLSDEPRVEDGPGWWAARAAIDQVHRAEEKPGSRRLRTAYVRADESPEGPDQAAVNAALVVRDQLLAGAGEQSLSVVAGLLAGTSQKEIAAGLGISPSAVSQRIRRDGLAAIVRADELLGGL